MSGGRSCSGAIQTVPNSDALVDRIFHCLAGLLAGLLQELVRAVKNLDSLLLRLLERAS